MTMIERPPRAPESPRHSKSISVRKKHALQLFKTDMCKQFQQGKCKHGEHCAFAHSAEEVRYKPELTRTSMCRVVLQGGVCGDPDCSFAHDKETLRATCGFFKTRMCDYARRGKCRSGDACRFAHVPEELRPLAPPAPEEGDSWPRLGKSSYKLPAAWAYGGRRGSGDSISSRSSSAETREQSPRRDSAGRRPPSSGSSSGAVSWASQVGPDSQGGLAAAANGPRKGALAGAQRGAAAAGRHGNELRRHGQEPRSSSLGMTSLKVSNVPRYPVALPPAWPVQPAGVVSEVCVGGAIVAADGGQMFLSTECAHVIMPMAYITSAYCPTMVVADPSGGAPCTNDMAIGANWSPQEAEVQPMVYQVPRWDLAHAEDEIYSD